MNKAIEDIGGKQPLVSVKVTWGQDLDETPTDEELVEGFHQLASILSVLGDAEHLPFEYWESLWLLLPEREIPFKPHKFPKFPAELLTNLRELRWKGHPRQLIDSWFPLTPVILQKVQTLYIFCSISPEDCNYVMRNATSVKQLYIERISGPFFSIPVLPPAATSDYCLPFLRDLWIQADTDISSVLEPLLIPSPRFVDVCVRHAIVVSSFLALENFISRHSPDYMVVRGSFSTDDAGEIRSKCNPKTTMYIFPMENREWTI
ncbi:hypothetical protein H0H92_014664 [Tricholoma furcatifolium]|nr:hypothetical protein H0H92_014664 [Tricholoma furcatifolium]